MIDQLPARTTLIAFFATVFIGGTNFVAVKFSNLELPPLFGAGVRFAVAALILLAIMRWRRLPAPRGRALAGAAIYGTLSFGLVYGLLYYALTHLNAGTTSVVMAAVPLATLVLAVSQGQEHFTMRGVMGGLLALGGIGVVSYRGLGGALPVLPLLAAVGGMVAASQSTVLVKGFPKSHPITTNAVGMSVGAAGLLAASVIVGEAWLIPGTPTTWIALTWLTIVGSVGMFGLFVYVIKTWKASASAYAVTMMPLVAVGLGALLLGEAITVQTLAGAALVAAGVYTGALSGRRAARRRAAGVSEPVLSATR